MENPLHLLLHNISAGALPLPLPLPVLGITVLLRQLDPAINTEIYIYTDQDCNSDNTCTREFTDGSKIFKLILTLPAYSWCSVGADKV